MMLLGQFIALLNKCGLIPNLKARIDAASPRRVVYAGDSNTQNGYATIWGTSFRSNATALTAGDGTLLIYDDLTATWAAPGDAAGPRTALRNGWVWFESDSANMGIAYYVDTGIAEAIGTPEGYEVTVTVELSVIAGYADNSPATWSQILSGQRLKETANHGMTGETAAGLLRRIDQVYNCDSFGVELPAAERPDHAMVMIGTNDITAIAAGGAGYTIADVKTAITAMADYARGIGKTITFATLPSETWGVGEFALAQELYRHYYDLAENNAHVTEADVFLAVRDGNQSDGRAISGAMIGVHYANRGAYYAGKAMASVIIALAGSVGRSLFRFAGDDSNLVTNGAMLNTAGVLTGTLATGDVAVDTACSNTLLAVFSKEAVAQETPWQVATVADSANNDTIVMTFNLSQVPNPSAMSELEYQVTSGGTFIKGIDAVLHYSDGATNDVYIHACGITAQAVTLPEAAFSGVLHVPDFAVPAWATTATLEVTTKFAADAVAVLKYRAAGAK